MTVGYSLAVRSDEWIVGELRGPSAFVINASSGITAVFGCDAALAGADLALVACTHDAPVAWAGDRRSTYSV